MVDPNHALLITLWLLISSEDTLTVSERFDITQTCCQLTYASVCQAIATHRAHFIQWYPNLPQGGVSSISCPNAIGVLGCTRFQQHSPSTIITVQAICDGFGKFIQIHSLSSTRDVSNAVILAGSPTATDMGSGRMFVGTINIPTTCHLIADQSYPLGNRLMVPYKSAQLTSAQRSFNASLAQSTAIMDRAFARLRERFAKLKGGFDEPIREDAVVGNLRRFVETALCVHNFCMLVSDSYYLDGTQQYVRENGQIVYFEDRAVPADVLGKRDFLADLIEQIDRATGRNYD